MNGNWGKVILFSILFCILGFILGRVTCGSCGGGACGPGGMRGEACMMKGGMDGEACMHGKKGKCCSMKGGAMGDDQDNTADSTAAGH